ncbi:MAG: hypothetical protein ACI9MC_003826, partial [Kiritimatiellia bacterium]
RRSLRLAHPSRPHPDAEVTGHGFVLGQSTWSRQRRNYRFNVLGQSCACKTVSNKPLPNVPQVHLLLGARKLTLFR